MGAVIHGPGEGERLEMGPSSLLLHAVSENTADTLFLSETEVAPGYPGPPLHVHERIHDCFYVLDGTLTFRVGDDEIEAGPGTYVCAPPGTPHTFSNRSDSPVRFLNFNTPAGFERYMREPASAGAEAAAEGRQLSPPEIGAIASKYDFRAVE
jgi:mannose-6-phosphate isomerase-like protein (cupin superfamily)